MITRPKFGTDGVRGTFGVDIDSEYAFVLGVAIARILGVGNSFVVGRDTRISGKILSDSLINGLESEGIDTQDLGIIPTPGVAMIAKRDSKCACVITASHNPAQDNGIKVFNVGGSKIISEIEKQIENEIEEIYSVGIVQPKDTTEKESKTLSTQEYVSYLANAIGSETLVGMKIVLDCANGAGFEVAPASFLLCGASVIPINVEADGHNINNDCGATHLAALVKEVRDKKADIGFAFDGDADRVIAVDETGTVRDGDFILALFASDMKTNNCLDENTLVATSMSNGALKAYCKVNNINFVETAVGDKFVLEAMLEQDYVLGGEQSGHIIRRDFANWGDGILNALLISRILHLSRSIDKDSKASEVLGLFEPMIQIHSKVQTENRHLAKEDSVINQAIIAEEKTLGENSRIIIRPSGTEPIVRITVEGSSKDAVANALARLEEVVESVCG